MDISKLHSIHFIGIGGIGVSALAKLMLARGVTVSGSDVVASPLTTTLERAGATIYIGPHRAGHVSPATAAVVHTNATLPNNPELTKAKRLRVPTFSYPEFLGKLLARHVAVVVSGTHGKSTTTAMIGTLFTDAGLDPTVVVGTKVPQFDGNVRVGSGNYFIIEGDEFHAAFHHYRPDILVLNNIESDHLDYYGTPARLVAAFAKVVQSVPASGTIIARVDDPLVRQVMKKAKARVITFGIGQGNVHASQINERPNRTQFKVHGKQAFNLTLVVPGRHNVYNALAAAAAGIAAGIRPTQIAQSLGRFRGTWRRFEVKYRQRGTVVIDDYAHHPTEIMATLQAARQAFPRKKVTAIFQPHSTHRTKSLYQDFCTAFTDCDTLILTDVYLVPGRETRSRLTAKLLGTDIARHGTTVHTVSPKKKILTYLRQHFTPNQVYLFMGAGDITDETDRFVQWLRQQYPHGPKK